jgi:hypothetical protein
MGEKDREIRKGESKVRGTSRALLESDSAPTIVAMEKNPLP